MHTRRGHYAPCFIDRHIFMVTGVTHPLVTLHKEITTLQIPIGVRSLTNEPQQRAPVLEAIHALGLSNLSRMVTMKEFFHRQPPYSVRHSPIQNLHAKEDPPGV